MKDRFVAGAITGALPGILINIVDYIDTNVIGFSKVRFMDYAAVLIYGNKANTMIESILALLGQIMFSAALGILFSYLLLLIGSQALFFKGWFYSNTIWFMIHSLMVLSKTTPLEQADASTVISNLISATIFGLVMPWVFIRVYNSE